YRLNDLLTISPDPCPCGSNFRVIKQVHGRADDVIYGKSKSTADFQFILPDFVRRSIVSSSDYIEEYSAIQDSPTNLTIYLQLSQVFNDLSEKKEIIKSIEKSILDNLRTIFSSHDSQVPTLEFKYEQIAHDFDTKLRRIRRTFK
ncbi:MAG: hypothetical protein ACTSQF_16280, partial [Candidatus Heimdallarchaeaceae archaeon]